MSSPSATGRQFFGRVESLRGLGALAVAAYHISGLPMHGVTLLPYPSWPDAGTLQNTLGRWCAAVIPAHAALMVFFVISGFVLRLSLEYGPRNTGPAVGKFLFGRVFRIYPVVMCSVLLTALLSVWQLSLIPPDVLPLTAPRVLANLLLLDTSMNSTLWALQVELLMVPVFLCVYFLERRYGPYIVVAAALALTVLGCYRLPLWPPLSGSPEWSVWPPFSSNLYSFILGMLVPTLGRRCATACSRRTATAAALTAGAVLLLTHPCCGLYTRSSNVLEGYAALVLVSVVAYRSDLPLLQWLEVRPLRLLGIASGSYYVLHMASIPVAVLIAAAVLPPAWSAAAPLAVGLLVIAAWLVALAPLSVASYYLVEASGIALGRRVIRWCRLDARSVPVASSQPASDRLAA